MGDKHKGKTWNCPLCVDGGKVAYGTCPCPGVRVCGNTPNANAHIYDKELKSGKTIGIGAISNETDKDTGA